MRNERRTRRLRTESLLSTCSESSIPWSVSRKRVLYQHHPQTLIRFQQFDANDPQQRKQLQKLARKNLSPSDYQKAQTVAKALAVRAHYLCGFHSPVDYYRSFWRSLNNTRGLHPFQAHSSVLNSFHCALHEEKARERITEDEDLDSAILRTRFLKTSTSLNTNDHSRKAPPRETLMGRQTKSITPSHLTAHCITAPTPTEPQHRSYEARVPKFED